MSEVPFDCQKAWDYIDEIYKGKDDLRLDEYIKATGLKEFGPPIEDEMSRLFKILLHLVKPKRVLEIGMSIGFSTTSLALAAKKFGGSVTTIEIDESMVEVARKAFEREGVSDHIEIKLGDAIEVLKEMESESFDVVFQDLPQPGRFRIPRDTPVRNLYNVGDGVQTLGSGGTSAAAESAKEVAGWVEKSIHR